MEKKPVILRMGRFGQGENLFRRIRHKEFLTSDTDALAAIARINL